MIGKTINELNLGDRAEFTKTVSESDVYLFAGVTGDFNPAHINEPYAEKTFFKTRIAHGMLPAGFISAILGTRIPFQALENFEAAHVRHPDSQQNETRGLCQGSFQG